MKAGYLLHIPQAVLLWSLNEEGPGANLYIQTEKPTTGIYLGDILNLQSRDALLSVFAKGKCWSVHEKDVYLFKGE